MLTPEMLEAAANAAEKWSGERECSFSVQDYGRMKRFCKTREEWIEFG